MPATTQRPTAAPEALAAQVSAMLAPFFRHGTGPAPILAETVDPTRNRPTPAASASRKLVEA